MTIAKCLICETGITQAPKGRKRSYCSGPCRQKAYRQRGPLRNAHTQPTPTDSMSVSPQFPEQTEPGALRNPPPAPTSAHPVSTSCLSEEEKPDEWEGFEIEPTKEADDEPAWVIIS
jgi:hypothetical protein